MKYIIAVSIILNLIGCVNTPIKRSSHNFVVKDTSSQYGMKYHFILETKDKISDGHNPFSKFILITHYHIYTNNLGKVSGDKVLFSKHNNTQPKKLTKNSTFTFNPSSVTIDGLQWCSSVYPHCENTRNGKYPIKEYSLLALENNEKENIKDKGYFK